MHGCCVVVLVCSLCNAVEFLEIEGGRESVDCFVDVGYGQYTAGVIKLVIISMLYILGGGEDDLLS